MAMASRLTEATVPSEKANSISITRRSVAQAAKLPISREMNDVQNASSRYSIRCDRRIRPLLAPGS